jgi:hypothetical protein
MLLFCVQDFFFQSNTFFIHHHNHHHSASSFTFASALVEVVGGGGGVGKGEGVNFARETQLSHAFVSVWLRPSKVVLSHLKKQHTH